MNDGNKCNFKTSKAIIDVVTEKIITGIRTPAARTQGKHATN
jgi:hypothetical protein